MWGNGAGQGMMGYGHDWSSMPMMLFGGIFWVVLLALGIAAFMAFVRRPGQNGHLQIGQSRSSALDILEERYARGELERDEYLQKKQDMSAETAKQSR